MKIGMRSLILGLYTITTVLDLLLFLFDPRAFHLAVLCAVSGTCVITILYRKPWSYWLLNTSAPLHFLVGGITFFATFRIYGLALDPSTLTLYLGLGGYSLLFLYLNFFLFVNRKNINLSL
jgi:hypothetical protein